MKILLLGDYSGLHVNLADGLRTLGHDVVVASDGNGYKNYKRDIDISWTGKFRYAKMIFKLLRILPKFIKFDVVQLIGMPFMDLRPRNNEFIFKFLRLFNKSVFLGSFTAEFEYFDCAVKGGLKKSFVNIKDVIENDPWAKEYMNSSLNPKYSVVHNRVTDKVSGIIACCAEYKIACDVNYADKTTFIPLPYQVDKEVSVDFNLADEKLKFFLGMQNYRCAIKGMDVLKEVLIEFKKRHPDEVEITIVDSIPYEEYKALMESSHIICDQLYSYGAGLNAVIAMSKGLVVAGGGEDEMYDTFHESGNKPLINLPVTKNEILAVFEDLLMRKEELPELAKKSREFAVKHHDHIRVAQQYVDFWQSKIDYKVDKKTK